MYQTEEVFMAERKYIGTDPEDVIIPIKPAAIELPAGYLSFIDEIKKTVFESRLKAAVHANRALVIMYWQIGRLVLQKQQEAGWGAKIIDRISFDMRQEFPDMKGFSPRNIKYMRKFAEVWDNLEFVQQVVAQIPWKTNLLLLEKLDDNEERKWYACQIIEHGWSSNVTRFQIDSKLMQRTGKEIQNFPMTLPPADSDMAVQLFKDPYIFDFLGTDMPRREIEIEKKLTEHIQQFLLELGQGFAFVGRQVHLEVGGDDFYIDLLFYHLKMRCYVVIELKACEFEPGFVSQLNMYQNIVNKLLRHPDDKPTIGLLLVRGKNETVVRYSLEGYTNPIGVSDWQNNLTENIPDDLKDDLPTIEAIEKELSNTDDRRHTPRHRDHG